MAVWLLHGKDRRSGIQAVLEFQLAGITGHAKTTVLLNTCESRNPSILNSGQIILVIHSQTKQILIIHRRMKAAP